MPDRGPVRARIRLDGPIDAQVRRAVELLHRRGGAGPRHPRSGRAGCRRPGGRSPGDAVAVLLEPGRPVTSRQLLGEAAALAGTLDGHVVALTVAPPEETTLGSFGADAVVHLDGSGVAEDVAHAVSSWTAATAAWATAGHRVGAARCWPELRPASTPACSAGDRARRRRRRPPARRDDRDGRADGAVQRVVGAARHRPARCRYATRLPTASGRVETMTMTVDARSRLRVRSDHRDDDLEALANAAVVVGVGLGVPPDAYPALSPLLAALDAQLGATRPVVDRGWLPHARQIGLTGRSVTPRLYLTLGLAGTPRAWSAYAAGDGARRP